ncbi:MAG: hypothetical protein KatS3mg110_1766 [Pirellulaceae bacterium]|nr:MAG: hypothetical protein KatS3mg110_1766 [Pirellulaceae bacterium]
MSVRMLPFQYSAGRRSSNKQSTRGGQAPLGKFFYDVVVNLFTKPNGIGKRNDTIPTNFEEVDFPRNIIDMSNVLWQLTSPSLPLFFPTKPGIITPITWSDYLKNGADFAEITLLLVRYILFLFQHNTPMSKLSALPL